MRSPMFATTGGSAAYYLGLAPLVGFIGGGVLGAGAMEVAGVERVRSRDLATGVVLGAATGLTALFLYLDTTTSATTGATQQILFGSIFTVEPSTIPTVAGLSALIIIGLVAARRPLLLSTLSPEMASAKGIHTRLISLMFLMTMAVAVGLSSIAIGSNSLDRPPHWSACYSATPYQVTRRLLRPCLRARRGDDAARHTARLRQQLLGLVDPGTPCELLHCGAHVRRVPLFGDPDSSPARARDEPTCCGCGRRSDPWRVDWSHGGRMMFSGLMLHAWEIGSIVAVVGGVVGFFVVFRGAAFEAHAIPNGAFAGAAGASLIGASTLLGLGIFAIGAALVIAFLSRRGRPDVVTALALVMMLALGAAFLSQTTQYEPEIFSLLFGEILGVSSTEILPVAALGIVVLLATGVLYRPLLYTSVVPAIADATGVPTFRIELLFLLVVALATTMTVPVVGALLIFSLMIGPSAAARCFTHRPARSLAGSVAIALLTVWSAIASAYATDWPVGFFVGVFGAGWFATGRTYVAVSSGKRHR